MATQPTQNAVPSESPRDLKFNAGKIDEFVTSLAQQYIDRFGNGHYTLEGLKQLAFDAMSNFGYVPLTGVTFTTGATLSNPNEVLFNNADSAYYKWSGTFVDGQKVVPPNSTPQSTGGLGAGKWLNVGDTVLRTELERGKYRTDATSCYYVPGMVVNETTNNRDAAYAFSGKIYIPVGVVLRCNFLPGDDVRKFTGEGSVLTKDQWGYEHVFNVSLSTKGSKYSASELINQGLINYPTEVSIGAVGDSITDGAWGKQTYTTNPNSGTPNFNLNSTSYDHSASGNGGSHSWFAHMTYIFNLIVSRRGDVPIFKPYNASLSGMKLSDGWAYRNFDYGFFQNSSYKNKAPNICILSMGWNDFDVTDFDAYLDKLDAFIRKAWGYGSAVVLVTLNRNDRTRATLESALKDYVWKNYRNVTYVDASNYLEKLTSTNSSNIGDLYIKKDGSYDITHPQPIGHAAMGSAVSYELAKNHIPKVKSGETLIPYTNKYFDCVGAVSGTHYQATARPASGNPYLAAIKQLMGWSPTNENVSMTALIFVEDDDSYLTVLEPFSHTYTTAGRSHNVSVFSPSGLTLVDASDEAKRTLTGALKLSSNGALLGDAKTLTTGACKLRYGLNTIILRYDGAPASVYMPHLMFTRFSSMGDSFREVRINFPASTAIQRFFKATSLDKISHPRMSSFHGSFLPNTFGGATQLAGSAKVKTLPDQAGVVVFYDDVIGTGVIIQRRGSTFYVGNIVGGAIVEANMTNTTISATGELNLGLYYGSDGKSSVSVMDSAAGLYSNSFAATGGTIGVYCPAATALTVSYQTAYLDL